MSITPHGVLKDPSTGDTRARQAVLQAQHAVKEKRWRREGAMKNEGGESRRYGK
jgi:hypothetical protein